MNLIPSNAWFEGVLLRPCTELTEIMENIMTTIVYKSFFCFLCP